MMVLICTEGKQINNLMKLLGDGDPEKLIDVLYKRTGGGNRQGEGGRRGTKDTSLKGSNNLYAICRQVPRGEADTMSTFLRAVMDSW